MPRLRNIFLILFLLVAASAHAQTVGQISTVEFSVDPETPGPNESVTITAEGVGGFLGNAAISWQQNGKTILGGAGESSFTFTTGALGSRSNIHVSINSPIYGNFTHDFVITPSIVRLIWEANTSVPPLYRGKALYSPGSQIKVVALPEIVSGGAYVSSNRLSYQWSVNGDPVTASSGLGRSTLTFSGNQLKEAENVDLNVYFGSSKVGHASLALSAATPSTLLYVVDPLRGLLLDQALPAGITLADKEVTIKAQPLYFAKEDVGSALTYAWTLDGKSVSSPNADKSILTLRQAGSGGGTSLLSLEIQNNNTNKFLQNTTKQLQIIFGQQTSSASPGFGI